MKKMVYLLAMLVFSSFTAAMDLDENLDKIDSASDSYDASFSDNNETEDQDTDSSEIDQDEIDDLCDVLTSEPESWTSYLLRSRARNVILGTCRVMDFATRNPQTTMIIGACLASQFTSVAAACNCTDCTVCTCWYYVRPQIYDVIGKVPNALDCINACKALNKTFGFCK